MADIPPEFFDAVDRFIVLANELTRDNNNSRVSSILMYAAARYNAHTVISLDEDPLAHRDEAIDYLTEQYRRMLLENFEEMLS
jgi:hypothetical protein